MQLHTDITENHTLKESLPLLNNNIATALSQSAGNAFPLTGLQVGMPCIRLDTGKAYVLTDAVAKTWKEYFDFTTGQAPDSTKFGGELPEFYQNAANLKAGTIPAARLAGTWRITVSGNAGSATKLATARTINGVSFNGTANITIADDTKIPLAGGVATGALGAPALGVTNSSNATGDGLSLYSGAKAGAPDYGLMFSGTATFGTHGAVVGDWATYFTMSGATNRGWIFKSGKVIGGNVASISATGVVTAADMKVGANQVWHAGNDGAGSGLDADLLDGAQLDAAATANTVAKRDASADINARLFRSNYANQATISGAIAFRINNSTDNYIRYCSDPAAVRTWLGAAPSSHTHTWAQVTGAPATATRWPTWAEVSGKPATMAPTAHKHGGADITVLGNRLSVEADGKVLVNNTATRQAGMYGIYDAAKIGHIWSMGPAYAIDPNGANFGTLYGLAYKHTNNATGGAMAGGHQMVWCAGGALRSAMGDNIWTAGNVTAYSDIRLKTNIEVIDGALDKVEALRGVTYLRKDLGITQAGLIAQEVLEVLPEVVTGGPTKEDPDGMYSVAYGNMVGLLIEAIKELRTELNQLKGVAA